MATINKQKITPFLWFTDRAEEAMDFYRSVFQNSNISNKSSGPDGKMFMGTMEIEGMNIHFLNGGPHPIKFSEATSFFVSCENQEEVDSLWNQLTAGGGEESRCGWLKDKFGFSWQIIPTALMKYMSDPDKEKANRVMQAMMKMNKIIVADLQKAYDGK